MTFATPTNLVPAQDAAALSVNSEVPQVASFNVKAGLAQMLKVHLQARLFLGLPTSLPPSTVLSSRCFAMQQTRALGITSKECKHILILFLFFDLVLIRNGY